MLLFIFKCTIQLMDWIKFIIDILNILIQKIGLNVQIKFADQANINLFPTFQESPEKTEQLVKRVMSNIFNNISKSELLQRMRSLGYKADCIFILLWAGKPDSARKNLSNKLKSLGFKSGRLSRGFYFLPPNKMPLLTPDFDPREWLLRQIRINSFKRLNISLITLLDLTEIKSIKHKPIRYDKDIIDRLEPLELLSIQNAIWLAKERKINIQDIF